MTEKPLHVRVAEALGWRTFQPDAQITVSDIFDRHKPYTTTLGEHSGGLWLGIPPNTPERHFEPPEAREKAGPSHAIAITLYDTDWAATGPLIEKYGLTVAPGALSASIPMEEAKTMTPEQFFNPDPKYYPLWSACVMAESGFWDEAEGRGDTPLIAVCECILDMKAKGKLEKAA